MIPKHFFLTTGKGKQFIFVEIRRTQIEIIKQTDKLKPNKLQLDVREEVNMICDLLTTDVIA